MQSLCFAVANLLSLNFSLPWWALEACRPTTMTCLREDAGISADGLPGWQRFLNGIRQIGGKRVDCCGLFRRGKVRADDRSGKVSVSGKDADWLSAPCRVIETPEISEPPVPLITTYFPSLSLSSPWAPWIQDIGISTTPLHVPLAAPLLHQGASQLWKKRVFIQRLFHDLLLFWLYLLAYSLQLLVYMDVFFRNFSPLPTCNVLPLTHTPSRITWDKWFPKSASIGSLFTRKPCKDQTPTSSHAVFALSS
ncbi:hypothetical protein ARMGADRAFT_425256 [Armillaria gallica]|uniref:Uncharacterized protein n=1 Tax=Armillaria gallica TaxID=47427 RepID=A0A2H3E1U4_ARMGA|nr:hypothetical protein ARMGADRAFT_425256 [Armillaria gallica]